MRFFNIKKLAAAAVALLFSAGISFALFTSSVDRIIAANQSFPVLSACGSATLATGSSDMAGEFTVGQAGCVLTFGTAYASAPSCVVTEETINTAARTTTVTASSITIAAGGAASKYSYVCFAKAGG